jgi:hypothetical protein
MNDAELSAVAEQYRQMSESELMDVAQKYDELTEPAQALLREEFSRRSLLPPLIDDPGVDVFEGRTLVTIRQYRDLPEAFVARSVLEDAGIWCFLRDTNMIGLQWGASNALGGVRLQVDAEDVAAAEEVLSQPIPASFSVDTGADFDQPVCPRCGSLDVVANDTNRKIALASTAMLGLPMIVGLPAMAMQRKDVWKCLTCGCKWYDDGEQPEPDAATPVN